MNPKALRRHMPRRSAGVAAVELALLMALVAIPLMLTVPLFLGRYFWHYTALNKAAHDAALYLSRVNQIEMRSVGPDGVVSAATLASEIANRETKELNPGAASRPPPTILCEYQESPGMFSFAVCDGFSLPRQVRVRLRTRVTDPFFMDTTADFSGAPEGILISSTVTMRYVGK